MTIIIPIISMFSLVSISLLLILFLFAITAEAAIASSARHHSSFPARLMVNAVASSTKLGTHRQRQKECQVGIASKNWSCTGVDCLGATHLSQCWMPLRQARWG